MSHITAVKDFHVFESGAEHHQSHAPIALIRAEHEAILECFHEIAKGMTTEEKYVLLIQRLCDQLTLYLSLKVDVVIPALRKVCLNPAIKAQIDEAIVEHFSLKILLETLDGQGPDDELFQAKLSVLQRQFIRHIAMEQRFLFPRLISFTPSDLEAKILEHKYKLRRKLHASTN